MRSPEFDPKIRQSIDYPQLHIEDSPRKIKEIESILPTSFRGRKLLDVGGGAGIITKAIASNIGAKEVCVVEPSKISSAFAEKNLCEFPSHAIHQIDFTDFKIKNVVDLTMFIDVLEHTKNPIALLKKAAQMSRYVIVRSPLENTLAVQIHKQLYGEDIPKIMEERYGHIYHFSIKDIRNLINQSDLKVIHESITRIPREASILNKPVNKLTESLFWRVTNSFYPEFWGGFYIAFLKSRNAQIIDQELAQLIRETLIEEFGEQSIVSIVIFGSTTRNADKKHSDYDFTVILKNLPSDVHQREQASPRIKRRLRGKGVDELCAFNFYTPEEFHEADTNQSWLIETMKTEYRVLYDKDNFLGAKLSNVKPTVEHVGTFAWRGVDYEDGLHLKSVIERYNQIAELIKDVHPQFSSYYRREGYRGMLIEKLYRHGEYDTRSSLLSLVKRLKYRYGENLNFSLSQAEDFLHEIEGKEVIYGYDQVDKHLQIAAILEKNGMPLDALSHAYSALRIIYLHALQSNDHYIVEGEITQLFLREFSRKISPELVEQIYKNSFKAEQILGRSGYVSFDLDSKGKPVYENPATSEFNYGQLMNNMREIVENLRGNRDIFDIQMEQKKPTISIVIATYNREEKLKNCLKGLNRLIIPDGKIELVIIDDGSEKSYAVEQLQTLSRFPIRYFRKQHSGICSTKNKGVEESRGNYIAFLDDDMVVSPLWLVQLMSGFKNDQIAGVGSTNLIYLDKNNFIQYIDYRELARKPFRDEIEEILNVLTGSACFKKDILEKVGGFNNTQSELGVTFGGDDVDLTWKIRNAGYLLRHVEEAITYHNHRDNIKALIKQHIGYGEGTMLHCIYTGRNPNELDIPNPTYISVTKDTLRYLLLEVPKRMKEVYKNHLGLKRAIQYPLLDLIRKSSYNLGILKARKFLKTLQK